MQIRNTWCNGKINKLIQVKKQALKKWPTAKQPKETLNTHTH